MIIASHQFQRRTLNVRDENGNEGCASCGRPRDAHPADHAARPAPEPRPEVRTCYCGTTATVVPGTFPHSDCDGSVRTAPGPAAEPGTALYLSAIARLSAGLREIQQACDRGDSLHAVKPVAANALADVDRLRLPQPAPGFRMILAQCPVHTGMAHAQIGDDDEWFCLRDLADTAEAAGGGEPGSYAPLPGRQRPLCRRSGCSPSGPFSPRPSP